MGSVILSMICRSWVKVGEGIGERSEGIGWIYVGIYVGTDPSKGLDQGAYQVI